MPGMCGGWEIKGQQEGIMILCTYEVGRSGAEKGSSAPY